MSKALFERGMRWKRERRAASGGEGAQAHIQAYSEYNRLVGEADGGEPLGEEEYAQLQRLAREASKNRLYVTWRNTLTGMDCYNVGPDSRCFCGHSYKAHAWWETESKRPHCRVPGCQCPCFDYIPGHGTFWPKCRCHHSHEEHRSHGLMQGCAQCDCPGFSSGLACSCGDLAECHSTTFETETERSASGRPIQSWPSEISSAACGAVTNFSSLCSGVDREPEKPVLSVGDRVVIRGNQAGYVRFVGPANFSEGVWCGVELDQPTGKNDGRVQGKRYFKCEPAHGCFVRPEQAVPYARWRAIRYK